MMIQTVRYDLKSVVFNGFLLYKDACLSFLFKGVQAYLNREGGNNQFVNTRLCNINNKDDKIHKKQSLKLIIREDGQLI